MSRQISPRIKESKYLGEAPYDREDIFPKPSYAEQFGNRKKRFEDFALGSSELSTVIKDIYPKAIFDITKLTERDYTLKTDAIVAATNLLYQFIEVNKLPLPDWNDDVTIEEIYSRLYHIAKNFVPSHLNFFLSQESPTEVHIIVSHEYDIPEYTWFFVQADILPLLKSKQPALYNIYFNIMHLLKTYSGINTWTEHMYYDEWFIQEELENLKEDKEILTSEYNKEIKLLQSYLDGEIYCYEKLIATSDASINVESTIALRKKLHNSTDKNLLYAIDKVLDFLNDMQYQTSNINCLRTELCSDYEDEGERALDAADLFSIVWNDDDRYNNYKKDYTQQLANEFGVSPPTSISAFYDGKKEFTLPKLTPFVGILVDTITAINQLYDTLESKLK